MSDPNFTDREVRLIHQIDDLATESARLRRTVTEARNILRDVPHAIEHGSLNVATEYVDRALTTLTR